MVYCGSGGVSSIVKVVYCGPGGVSSIVKVVYWGSGGVSSIVKVVVLWVWWCKKYSKSGVFCV